MSDSKLSRRGFLARTAAVGAGALLYGCGSSTESGVTVRQGRVIGANEDIRVAIVGFNGRGGDLLNETLLNPGVRVVALCDVDRDVLQKGIKKFEQRNEKVDTYQDIRQVLDRNDIDAILTAPPNHWHALATVWACQAGKDVYVEKPASHTIWEGRKMVEAAKKYNRMVQVGMQRRSDTAFYELVDYLRSGKLGKIVYAKALNYKLRGPIGKVSAPTPIPAAIDYSLWCGPAPDAPLMRKRLHYDWHWVWVTGNGDMGNQGVHEIDQCRWILGYDNLPPRVYSFGGRFSWVDDGQTPNTQVCLWGYPIPIYHETRNMPRKAGDSVSDNVKTVRIGIYIQCEDGYYAGGSNGGWTYRNDDSKDKQFVQQGASKHTNNFFKAVRSRKASDLNCPVEQGHLSAALCHMGNISYRVGQTVPPSQLAEAIRRDKCAAQDWDSIRGHLAANNVDVDKELPTLGPSLAFDPEKERFIGPRSDDANKLLTRASYRKPFVIPEKV